MEVYFIIKFEVGYKREELLLLLIINYFNFFERFLNF